MLFFVPTKIFVSCNKRKKKRRRLDLNLRPQDLKMTALTIAPLDDLDSQVNHEKLS